MDAGGPARSGAQDTELAVVLDRLRSARDPRDRISSVNDLKTIAQAEPVRVGKVALSRVLDLLRARHLRQLDDSTAQCLLELLQALFSHEAGGKEVLSAFLADATGLDALLDLLEGTPTLIAVTTLQVLTAALHTGPLEVASVLQHKSQQGVVRLISCLSDKREEVKNEVLLVLTQLVTATKSDAIKTMVAMNDGFDRILEMMEEDGGFRDGTVITLDCLRLLGHLVQGSQIVQRQFCELDSLQRLAPSFDLTYLAQFNDFGEDPGQADASSAPALTATQRDSLYLGLELIRRLAAGPAGGDGGDERLKAERTRLQNVILGTRSLLRSLIQLGTAHFDEETAGRVQDEAFVVLSELVESNEQGQMGLLEARVDHTFYAWSSPAVSDTDRAHGSAYVASVILRLALRWPLKPVRLAALRLWHRIVDLNPMAAIMVVQHIIAPPPPPLDLPDDQEWEPATAPGMILLEELLRAVSNLINGIASPQSQEEAAADREAAQAACFLLEHLLIQGGNTARELASRVVTDLGAAADGQERRFLLEWVPYLLSQCLQGGPALEGVQVALLRLLAAWTTQCPTAARTILRSTSNLFLVSLITAHGSNGLQGFAGSIGGSTSSPTRNSLSRPGPGEVVATVGLSGSHLAHARALAALLVGLCLEHWGDDQDDQSGLGRQEILSMIETRVGLSSFTAALESLERLLVLGRNFVHDWPPMPDSSEAQLAVWPYYDSRFISWYRQEVKVIRKRLFSIYSGLDGGAGAVVTVDARVTQYQDIIAQQEHEIDFLKSRVEKILNKLQALQRGQVAMSPMPFAAEDEDIAFSGTQHQPRSVDVQERGNVDSVTREDMVAVSELAEERLLREAAEQASAQKEGELQGVIQALMAAEDEDRRKDARIAELMNEVGQTRAEVEGMRAQLQAKDRGASVDQASDDEDSRADAMAELFVARHEVQALRGELDSTRAELRSKKDELNKQGLELQKATKQSGKLAEDKNNLELQLNALAQDLESLTTQYEDAQHKLEQSHKATHTESQRFKRATEENERLVSQKHELKTLLEEHRNEASTLRARFTQAAEAAGEEKVQALASTVEELQKQLRDTETRELRFRESSGVEMAKLSTALDEAEALVREERRMAAEELGRARQAEVEALKRCEQLAAQRQKEIAAFEEEMRDLRAAVGRASDERDRARAELDRAVQGLDAGAREKQAVVARLKKDLQDRERVLAESRETIVSLQQQITVRDEEMNRLNMSMKEREEAALKKLKERDQEMRKLKEELGTVMRDRDTLAGLAKEEVTRVKAHMTEMAKREKELQERNEAAREAIEGWQARVAELERQLTVTTAEKDAAAAQVETLMAEVMALRQQVAGSQERASPAATQPTPDAGPEAAADDRLDAALRQKAEADSQVAALHAEVQRLQHEAHERHIQATQAIEAWQLECQRVTADLAAAQQTRAELETSLRAEVEKLQTEVGELKAALEEKDGKVPAAVTSADDDMTRLKDEAAAAEEQARKTAEDAARRVLELEERLSAVHADMTEQSTARAEVEAALQEREQELGLLKAHTAERDEHYETQVHDTAMKESYLASQLEEARTDAHRWAEQLSEKAAQVDELQQRLTDMEALALRRNMELHDSSKMVDDARAAAKKDIAAAERHVRVLEAEVTSLKGELSSLRQGQMQQADLVAALQDAERRVVESQAHADARLIKTQTLQATVERLNQELEQTRESARAAAAAMASMQQPTAAAAAASEETQTPGAAYADGPFEANAGRETELVESIREDVSRLGRTLSESTEAEVRKLKEYQEALRKKDEELSDIRQELLYHQTRTEVLTGSPTLTPDAETYLQACETIRSLERRVDELLQAAEAREQQHQAEVEGLRGQVEREQNDMSTMHEKIVALEQREAIVAQNAEQPSYTDDRSAEVEELQAQLAQSSDQLALVTREFQSVIDEKRKENDSLAKDRHDYMVRSTRAEEELQRMRVDLEVATRKLDVIQRDADREISKRQDQLDALKKRYDALASRRHELAELYEADAVKTETIKGLEAHVAELESHIHAMGQASRGAVEEKDGELVTLRVRVEQLERLQGEADGLRNELEQAREEVARQHVWAADAEREMNRLSEEVMRYQLQHDAVAGELGIYKQEHERLTEDVHEYRAEIQTLSEQLEQQRVENERISEELHEYKTGHERLAHEVRRHKSEHEAAALLVDTLRAGSETIRTEAEELGQVLRYELDQEREQNEQLKVALSEAEKRAADACERAQELEAELRRATVGASEADTSYQQELERLRLALHQSEAASAVARDEMERWRSAVEHSAAEVDMLRLELETAHASAEQLQHTLDAANIELQDAHAEVIRGHAELEDLRAKASQPPTESPGAELLRLECQRMAQELHATENEVSRLTNELDKARMESERLRTGLEATSAAMSDVEALRNQAQQMFDQLHGAQREVSRLTEDAGASHAEVFRLQQALQDARAEAGASQAEAIRLQTALNEAAEDAYVSRESSTRLETTLRETEGVLNASRTEVSLLETALREAQGEAVASRGEVTRLQAALEEASRGGAVADESSRLASELNVVRSELAMARRDVDGTTAEVRRLMAELDAKVAEVVELRTQLNGKDGEMAKMQSQLDASHSELEDHREEFLQSQETIDSLLDAVGVMPPTQVAVPAQDQSAEIDDLRQRFGQTIADLEQRDLECISLRASLDEARRTAKDAALEAVVVSCLAMLEERLGLTESATNPSAATDEELAVRLRQSVDDVGARLATAEQSLHDKRRQLEEAVAELHELKNTVDGDLESGGEPVRTRVQRVHDEKDQVIHSLQAELATLRGMLAQPAVAVEVPPPVTAAATTASALQDPGMGGRASSGSNLMMQGLMLELSSLKTDYEALRSKHVATQEEAATRNERLKEQLEKRDEAVSMLTRELNRLRHESEFETKVKAGMLQERDRSIEALTRRLAELKRMYSAQAESLQGRTATLEEENETLRREMNGVNSRIATMLKAKEKAVSDLQEELVRRAEHDRTALAQAQAAVREKDDQMSRATAQVTALKKDQEKLRKELEDLRLRRDESMKDLRRELQVSLEAKSALQLELNARELQTSALKRDVVMLQADAARLDAAVRTQRDAENKVKERDRRIETLEADLRRAEVAKDTLRARLDDNWAKTSMAYRHGHGTPSAVASPYNVDGDSRRSSAAGPIAAGAETNRGPSWTRAETFNSWQGGGGSDSPTQGRSGTTHRQVQQVSYTYRRQHHEDVSRAQESPVRLRETSSSPMKATSTARTAAANGVSGGGVVNGGQHQHHASLEDDLRYLQTKLSQLRKDLGDERKVFHQLEVEHEDLLEVLANQSVGSNGHVTGFYDM